MRTFLVALLALAAAPSLAEARTGKGVTFIVVQNEGSDFLAVIDRSFSFPSGSNPSLNAAAFFRAGGRLVPPGSFTIFVIKGNGSNGNGSITRTLTAAYVTNLGSRFAIGDSDSTTVTVERGGTETVVVDEGSSGEVIFED